MRNTTLLTLFLALLYFGAGEASAQCACAPDYVDITPHKEFKLADAVFVGKVAEVKKTDYDRSTGAYTEAVSFEVEKAWKRDLPAVVVITNRVDSCSNGFEEKEEWLVYAYRGRGDTLVTGCCCSRTRTLSRAGEDLREFESKGEKPRKIIKAVDR